MGHVHGWSLCPNEETWFAERIAKFLKAWYFQGRRCWTEIGDCLKQTLSLLSFLSMAKRYCSFLASETRRGRNTGTRGDVVDESVFNLSSKSGREKSIRRAQILTVLQPHHS